MADGRRPWEEPVLVFAFEVRADVGPEERVGNGDGDVLYFVSIDGGTVSGPRFNGTVVPGGGDWFVRRGPTCIQLDARYLLRAEDGALVDVVNHGYYRTRSPEVMERADRGEPIDPADLYYRTSPVFRTDAPAHRWLAESVFVGLARSEGEQVCVRFYELL